MLCKSWHRREISDQVRHPANRRAKVACKKSYSPLGRKTCGQSARAQLFFFSIFRFSVMSFRLSKLDTVCVADVVPAFSAWIS